MADLVRITVLWHRDCAEGRDLAAEIFRWFRGDPNDPGEAGRGIPVQYRCFPEEPPGAGDAGAAARVEIAVALVDEHMVVDPRWRGYLMSAVKPRVRLLVPVALDATAYQLPFAINRLNFLRLDRAVDPDTWGWEERSHVRRERLVSLLTQVIARELLALAGADDPSQRGLPPPQITVFISHAKADGVQEAEAVRSAILGSGQMRAFYDESDLPIGYAFAQRLEDAAGRGGAVETQAMVVIYSDSYPTRPWCQRELRLARTPQRRAATGPGAHCWRVKPMVIAASLTGAETRMLGEVGQAPHIAWDPARVGRVVDLLLREILLLRYNDERALELLKKPDEPDHSADGDAAAKDEDRQAGRHALNCIPDLYTAMEIRHACAGTLTELLIPPPGLPREDREMLGRLMSDGDEPVAITTFDDAELMRK